MGRSGTSWPLPSSLLGLGWLKLMQTLCMLPQSHELICLIVVSWSHLLPLALTVFLAPVQHRSLSLEDRGGIQICNFRLSIPKSLIHYTLPVVGFFVLYHLLKGPSEG